MGRKLGRTPDQTRQQVRSAARRVIRRDGISATLDDIAREAEVSKGGLVYHFASKDELIEALAAEVIEEFRVAVDAALDPTDVAPGRLARAYIRASLDMLADETTAREQLVLAAQLMTSPPVAELIRTDANRWEVDLQADGLPQDILSIVIAAADGACTAPVWGGAINPSRLTRLEEHLIALTHNHASWIASVTPCDEGGVHT